MIDERALLPRLRALEEEALVAAYDAFQPPLYRYAYRLLGRVDVAEDVVAETFQRLIQALHRGQGPRRHIQAWLYRVTHNLAVDHYRRDPPSLVPLTEELAAAEKPDEEMLRRLAQERVRLALRRLTPDQQQVILLKFLEDLSNEEVAVIMGKPVGAIKSLQHRALASLRRILERSAPARQENRP